MESFLGFREPPTEEVVFGQSHSLKLVPWMNWDEWKSVRESLFSSSPVSVASALQRITAWRSRGCLPVLIDVTAVFIEIQQKDPFFRDDFTDGAVDTEEMLATLYCMAIVRLVNAAIEKTRKKTEISIAEAASVIGIPRMLIDIHHECSHRDLPSLQLVRLASMKALDWLKSYYWEPQNNAIPNEGDQMSNIRKKIKHRLREFAICLKEKQRSGSSLVKGKQEMGEPAPFDMEKLMSYSDDLVKVLKDDKDISTLKQSLQQSQAVCSQVAGDYNHLENLIEDLQRKIEVCRQKIATSKSEIVMDEEIDLLQKELKEQLQIESLLKEELRVIACGIHDMEQESISIEESRQVLKKHDQDELRTQMRLSMYASVTSIIPNLDDASNISGQIVDREKKNVEKFELDRMRQTSFETCNEIWKLIGS